MMLPSLPSLLNAHIRSQNARNVFKSVHNASRRSTMLPKPSPNIFMFMLTCIPYHTCRISMAACIKSPACAPLLFKTSSFSRCVYVSCKKHVGKLYLSVTFGKILVLIIRSFVFLEPWCVNYFLAVKVPQPLPNAPRTPKDVGTNVRKSNRAKQ